MTALSQDKPILVIDGEPTMCTALGDSLQQMGHPVTTASNGEEALSQCTERSFAAAVIDLNLPDMSGMDLFREIKKIRPQLPIILMSAYGTIEDAVEAMRSGARDYLVKPFLGEALQSALRRALLDTQHLAPAQPNHLRSRSTFLTQDPATLKLLKTAEVVAASQASIFIEGESGTGKELLARFIHDHSPRAHRPFIAINCAAVPENLLESELFGYEKGAFTGATSRKAGRFELANTGTILLDEVSEMPLSLQAKLLRVLQEREIDLLGGRQPVPLDIRVIATTNRPLWEEVKAGRFREDLYYRLNVFPFRIQPLRNRISDIPFLLEHFLCKVAVKNRKTFVSVKPEALSILMGRPWNGNIRELENVAERAILLAAEDGVIAPEHLLFEEGEPPSPKRSSQRHKTVWEAERELILETLDQFGGNRTHAAKTLGISIRTLRNKLREYRQSDPQWEKDKGEGKNFHALGKEDLINCQGPR